MKIKYLYFMLLVLICSCTLKSGNENIENELPNNYIKYDDLLIIDTLKLLDFQYRNAKWLIYRSYGNQVLFHPFDTSKNSYVGEFKLVLDSIIYVNDTFRFELDKKVINYKLRFRLEIPDIFFQGNDGEPSSDNDKYIIYTLGYKYNDENVVSFGSIGGTNLYGKNYMFDIVKYESNIMLLSFIEDNKDVLHKDFLRLADIFLEAPY